MAALIETHRLRREYGTLVAMRQLSRSVQPIFNGSGAYGFLVGCLVIVRHRYAHIIQMRRAMWSRHATSDTWRWACVEMY